MNDELGATAVTSRAAPYGAETAWPLLRAMRPAQWIKNGLVFAGLVYGGKLFDPGAVASAAMAALLFCVLSSGFYLVNDVRDMEVDRLHPDKRLRPVAAGEIRPVFALIAGLGLIGAAIAGSALLGWPFLSIVLTYAALMSAYNLGVKHVVIADVFAIAGGFVLRAVGGAVAVDVSISPWLLLCTMLLALLLAFGKRHAELVGLANGGLHRRNLDAYSRAMLDQSVAITAAGTIIAYAIYSLDTNNVAHDGRFVLTVPLVAYGVFRYLYLLYHGGGGGAPESLLLTDRALLAAVSLWAMASAALLYWGG